MHDYIIIGLAVLFCSAIFGMGYLQGRYAMREGADREWADAQNKRQALEVEFNRICDKYEECIRCAPVPKQGAAVGQWREMAFVKRAFARSGAAETAPDTQERQL